jgi:hypothetical protein
MPSEHQMRERRACLGELVQIDGSDHAWFEDRGPKCTLLVYIDDATGQLLELWFVPDETTFAYFEASRHYFERYGKPVAFYSDKHGIFRVNQPRPLGTTSGLTQFGRAMEELDIQLIAARSPQAKDYDSYCTSFARTGMDFASNIWRRLDSFCPMRLVGASGPGGSNR